jgi:hypothetical protein
MKYVSIFFLEFIALLIGAHIFSKPFYTKCRDGACRVSVSMFVGGTGAGLFLAGALIFDTIAGKLGSAVTIILPAMFGLLLLCGAYIVVKKRKLTQMLFLMLSLSMGALALARLSDIMALLFGLTYGVMISILGYILYAAAETAHCRI